MKWNVLPYALITALSVIAAFIRTYALDMGALVNFWVTVFQIAMLSLVWIVIKTIGNKLNNYLPFEESVVKRTLLQILISLVIITPLYVGFVHIIRGFHLAFMNTAFLAIGTVLFFVLVLFMNLAYNAYFFFREWENSIKEKAQLQIEAAELGKDRSMMKYHHLKNQVNPHFLFNTFTSLDGLIQTDPDLASDFVRHLSKVYRYVLQNKENEVVTLQTEIDFIGHYIRLLKIRYKDTFGIKINISEAALDHEIVMVTLQMLIDNAIKHNSLQVSSPLNVTIWDEGDYLHVRNNKQLRKQIETSNQQGLQQLKELYSFLTDKQVIVNDKAEFFEIKLPLL
ncbi:histidine kinase [Mucilaginibacter terrigena]|uniref:Histidine kinase n=1 Tax=Mucilaginibacter terrigena TaxID=2492395 RepID=A0A4Q5LQX8_9SPHI|nr:histidine kinase [Mucilaginibacter terrigena]RYU91906.1 histidine kinase [Mucilaginibacter terrigena]